MASPAQYKNPDLAILPVTAIQSVQHAGIHLLLLGKGNLLEVHSVTHGEPLCRNSILAHHTIHGIIILGPQPNSQSFGLDILAYGGRQVTWVVLSLSHGSGTPPSTHVTLIHTCWLQDWILCVRSCMSHKSSAVLLTSYNALCSIKINAATQQLESSNLYDCLSTFLYSADVFQVDQNSFVIASGTAFGELLIWLCRLEQHSNTWLAYPWREYRGHSGSIFGICISPAFGLDHDNHRLVATCSDDRTIHIWDASSMEKEAAAATASPAGLLEGLDRIFPQCEQELIMTWGHLSRIWSIDFIVSTQVADEDPRILLLSTGEDGQAQSWLLEAGKVFSSGSHKPGALTNQSVDRHHAGKNIWSRCYSRNELQDKCVVQLFTGGADAQVIQRSYDTDGHASFGALRVAQQFKTIRPTAHDGLCTECVIGQRAVAFKSYLLCGADSVIVTTDTGLLLQSSLTKKASTWQILAQASNSQHFILSSNMAQQHAYFVDRTRLMLCVIDVNSSELRDICEIRSAKVSKVQVAWSEIRWSQQSSCACVAVSYFGNEDLELVWVTTHARKARVSKTLVTLPEAFETTSACVDMAAEVLLLGSRAGATAAYTDINDCTSLAYPTVCRRRVHGEDTITSITVLKEEPYSSRNGLFYLTTGRDGMYCAIELCIRRPNDENGESTLPRLRVAHQATPPLSTYIEGAQLVEHSGSAQKLLLYGFHSKQFVAWDETNQTQVMAVDCGGAHRGWDFRLDKSTSGGGAFVWTKAGTFMFYQQTQADHKIIQSGSHGREIKALAVHYAKDSKWLVATGSEDTDIRLAEYTVNVPGKSDLKNISVIKKHTTGLQDLHFSADGTALISAAGMEEMFVWSLSPVPVLGQGVVFAGALPRSAAQSDARVMSFDIKHQYAVSDDRSLLIVAAFSNGKVKTIQYNPPPGHAESGTFKVLSQLDLGTMCLTQAHILPNATANHSRSIIGATNGSLTSTSYLPSKSAASSITTALHRVHQNSITAMQIAQLASNCDLIVTGGDDNSLALTISHHSPDPGRKPAFRSLTIPKAQAAALTALAVIEVQSADPQLKHFTVITAGNDQRVHIWRLTLDMKQLHQIVRTYERGMADQAGSNASGSFGQGLLLDEIQVGLQEERYTNVADISEVAILRRDSGDAMARSEQSMQIMVVGVGIEVLDVELPRWTT